MPTDRRAFLVDTNALLFATFSSSRLSTRARQILEDPDSDLVWSTASTWEVVVKARMGKLKMGGDPAEILTSQITTLGLRILPVTQSHALKVGRLPDADWVDEGGVTRRHADPFDRLIVAQALVEGLLILSADEHLGRYGVARIW